MESAVTIADPALVVNKVQNVLVESENKKVKFSSDKLPKPDSYCIRSGMVTLTGLAVNEREKMNAKLMANKIASTNIILCVIYLLMFIWMLEQVKLSDSVCAIENQEFKFICKNIVKILASGTEINCEEKSKTEIHVPSIFFLRGRTPPPPPPHFSENDEKIGQIPIGVARKGERNCFFMIRHEWKMTVEI